MKICIIYSFKSELYIKNTFLKREFEITLPYHVLLLKCNPSLSECYILWYHRDGIFRSYNKEVEV